MISCVSPVDLLRLRLRVVADDLQRARGMLEALDDDALLPATVRNPLRDLLGEQVIEAQRLDRRLDGSAPSSAWSGARELRQDAGGLLRETLGCLEAAFIRRERLDAGLCAVTDRLLRSLAESTRVTWLGSTIVGGDERFARQSQLVHLRFPEFTMWALPLAAHEFGHLVAQELAVLAPDGTKRFPVADELSAMGDAAGHYGELFSDVFATWVLGPAYACTAVLLRFTPDRGDVGDHPADWKRVLVTLGTVDQLSREHDPVALPYHPVLSTLKETWAAALTGADRGELEPEDEATLTMWRQRVVVPLLQRRMPDARYSGWGNALRIADALCSDGSFDPTGGSRPPVADVLNAAWIGRLRHWDDRARVDRIEQRARQLCGAQEVAR
jgi:hypothetical protein